MSLDCQSMVRCEHHLATKDDIAVAELWYSAPPMIISCRIEEVFVLFPTRPGTRCGRYMTDLSSREDFQECIGRNMSTCSLVGLHKKAQTCIYQEVETGLRTFMTKFSSTTTPQALCSIYFPWYLRYDNALHWHATHRALRRLSNVVLLSVVAGLLGVSLVLVSSSLSIILLFTLLKRIW